MSGVIKQPWLVLLADDDQNDLILFKRAILSTGLACDVRSVANGAEVIRYLTREGIYADAKKYPLPRFLILDLKMPLRTGFDVLQWLQEHPECKIIPTIAFSSSSLAEDVKKAYQLGVNSYFTKPNDFEELKTIFHLLLNYWGKANVPSIPASQRCE
jgi:CheY-like chemotaxis protein